MAQRDDEDEGLKKFMEQIEQKCSQKSVPKKRKVYLGPDSIDAIPRRSKYRFQNTNTVSPPDLVDNSTSSTSRQSIPTNDDESTSPRSFCDQIVSATHHSTQENQILVAHCLVDQHTTAVFHSDLSHYENNSSFNLSGSPSHHLVCSPVINVGANTCTVPNHSVPIQASNNVHQLLSMPASSLDRNYFQAMTSGKEADGSQGDSNEDSQNMDDEMRDLNPTLDSEANSTLGSRSARSQLQSDHHHQSRSGSRTPSGRSRSSSQSSLSLSDSDNESDVEHDQGEQPVNDHANEERGRGEEDAAEQDQPDQPAGGEVGEDRDIRAQDEQQDGEAGEERDRAHEEHEPEARDRPPTHGKLREAMLGGFLNNIEIPVEASRNDVLYLALSLASKNNDTNTAFCNLINLINCIFVSPVLPSSQYLLDNLLVSDVGVHYHFYCKMCFNSFGELDYKNIKFRDCDICATQNNVSDLRLSTFFVIFDLPVQLEILFSQPEVAEALTTPAEAVARSQRGLLTDIYDGSMYKEFCASTANFQERIISMHLSVDGSPIAKSSSASIWPIQGQIHELPSNMRMKNLLLCGLWFGKNQPKMNLFLPPFVSHMRTLSQGFHLHVGPNNRWDIRMYCIGCCVDSGARGSVQGIKTHGGYYACNWCL